MYRPTDFIFCIRISMLISSKQNHFATHRACLGILYESLKAKFALMATLSYNLFTDQHTVDKPL